MVSHGPLVFPAKESDHLSKRPVNPKQKALSHDVQ